MVGIYKITSPSNRCYVGQSQNIEIRINKYKTLNCKKQIKLYNSLKKYNYKNHKFEVLEECLIEQLDERETYYKQLELDKVNRDWKKVLFCYLVDRKGGQMLGKKLSNETKQKMSLAKLGTKDSKQTRKKKSLAHKGIIKSKEWKEKIGLNHPFKKAILQYNLNMELINEYISINDAARQTNIGITNISNCCIRNSKKINGKCTSHNYIWKYKY